MYMKAHITTQDYEALASLLWNEAMDSETEARKIWAETDTAQVECDYRPAVEHTEGFDYTAMGRYRLGFTDVTGHGFRITLARFYDAEGREIETDFDKAELEALLND